MKKQQVEQDFKGERKKWKKEKVTDLENENEKLRKSNSFMSDQLLKNNFFYEQLSLDEKSFNYMSGLSKEKFDLLYECVKPYLHLVSYAVNG